jgi:putative transposase
VVSLAAMRQIATFLEQTHDVSERRACRILLRHHRTKRRQPGQYAQSLLMARIHALSERYPRFEYRKIYALRKAEQWHVRRETVQRLRKREGLVIYRARSIPADDVVPGACAAVCPARRSALCEE